jgi:hypothetical protein
MNQHGPTEEHAGWSDAARSGPAIPPSTGDRSATSPVAGPSSEPDVGGVAPYPFVYALGRVEPRFPSLAVEKEFAQVTGRSDTAGLTDREVLKQVLTATSNRYLARQLCWLFTIEGIETYVLRPRYLLDQELLVEAIRVAPDVWDIDLVVGLRGPIAPPEACNGVMLPFVAYDQIYSFTRDALVAAIPRADAVPESAEGTFRSAAGEVFDRIMRMTDNAGATDEDRALNYLAVRYPAIYTKAAEKVAGDFSLTAIDARPSSLTAVRTVVDVIFSYTNRASDFTEKYLVRVDVTEEFPFLVTKLSPYFER